MEYLSIPWDAQAFELKEFEDGLFNCTPKKSLANIKGRVIREENQSVGSEQPTNSFTIEFWFRHKV